MRVPGEIDPLWEVLSKQSVGIFVGPALPRALRVAEIDLNIGGHGESLVVGRFLAAIPGQRSIELLRSFLCTLDQGVNDGLRISAAALERSHISAL